MPTGMYKHTKQHNKNISIALLGKKKKPFTEEHIRNLQVSHLGYKMSQAQKHKIRIGVKKNLPKTSFKKGFIPWSKGKKCPQLCKHKNGNWNSGRYYHRGYVYKFCQNHPNKRNGNYVREHRLIMERHLGRLLSPKEVVHHINGIKDDNRIENLMLFSNTGLHGCFHRWRK